MGILKKIFRRNKKTISIKELANEDFFSNYTSFSELPEIKTCIRIISDTLSNATIKLFENRENGDIRIKDGLAKKIDIAPFSSTIKKHFIYYIVENLIIYGNAYAIIELTNKEQYVADLVPVPTNSVNRLNDGSYLIDNLKYSSDEILHFMINPKSTDIFKGTGYKVDIKKIADNIQSVNNIRNKYYKNEYFPNLVISVDGDDDIFTQSKDKLDEMFFSATKGSKAIYVPSNLAQVNAIKPLSLNDLAVNDSVEIDKKTIANLFGVPTFLLGVGTFNQEEYNLFINVVISSFANAIEQELTKKILWSGQRYFKFDINKLYYTTYKERSEVGKLLYSAGLMTGNEVRNQLNLSPLNELNELLILENYIKVADVDKQKKLKGGETDEQNEE